VHKEARNVKRSLFLTKSYILNYSQNREIPRLRAQDGHFLES